MPAIKLPGHRLEALGVCKGYCVCDSLKPHCCYALHATARVVHHLNGGVLWLAAC